MPVQFPAALEAPEVAEGGASPTVEAALHGEDAVQLGGRQRDRDAPEEGHESEEHQGHAGAGVVEDAFVAEGPAAGVAVENREQRKKPDLAEARAVGREQRIVFCGGFWHRAGALGVKRGMLMK